MKKIVLLYIFLSIFSLSLTQSAHYSQIHELNQQISPSLVSNSVENSRFLSSYRKQWGSFGPGYTSQNLRYETQFKGLLFGALFQNNNAGKNSLRENQYELALGYNLSIDYRNKISVGVGVGVLDQFFDPNNLSFEEQYSLVNGYNPNASNGENFIATKVFVPALSIGATYKILFSKKMQLSLSTGVKNLLSKRSSFLGTELINNETQLNVLASSDMNLSKNHTMNISFLSSQRDLSFENKMAVVNKFKINNLSSFLFGFGIRLGDSFNISAGLEQGRFRFLITQDFSTSRLQGVNATEVSLVFNLGKTKNKKNKIIKPKAEKIISDVLDNDFDKDGIPNEEDVCPYEYGVQKYNGCPFKDTDKDGVTDDVDLCPELFGSGNISGCPDSDGDGITDNNDKCPTEKGEIFNGGCPFNEINVKDVNEPINSSKLDTLVVYFEENSSEISAEFIKDVIDFTKEINDETMLIIVGHTNSNGNQNFNEVLSIKRAKNVIELLKSIGVKNVPMVPVGYGESKPALPNTSQIGKTINRRVELIKLTK